MNRRTFGTGLAAAMAAGPGCSRQGEDDNSGTVRATGIAFGTETAVTLPAGTAPDIFEGAFEEIARLEKIVTLWDPRSPLRRLNDAGRLADPPPELLEILEISGRVHRLTGGAFDPTVQPLWELYEGHFATHPADRKGPDPEAIAEARSRIGWENVALSKSEIRFGKPGMAMTLNGIAPGFAADRVAGWLQARGVVHALVDAGEYRAVGTRPVGQAWEVAIRGEEKIVAHAALDGNALATSAGYATAFDLERRFHHLFHPERHAFQPATRIIAVEAPEAALADALATAGAIMDRTAFETAAQGIPNVRARIFDAQG